MSKRRSVIWRLLIIAIILSVLCTCAVRVYKSDKNSKSEKKIDLIDEGSTYKKESPQSYTKSISNDNKIVKIVKKILNHNVELRKFPYPYKSMLALCSDIDGTTLTEFLDYHRFLNTDAETEYGKGLGLDVGDTFWMYVGNNTPGYFDYRNAHVKDEMSYWYGLNDTKLHDANEIIKFYKDGWIDCMHTYGDFTMQAANAVTFNKKYAVTAINELKKQRVFVMVWLDHGSPSNVQNFVSSNIYRYQQGDNPKSRYYHTNLLIHYGIKFGWGPTSKQFGFNSMLFPRELKDGNKIWVFFRYSDSINGNLIWTPEYIDKELSENNLLSLINNHQYAIVAQHLGIRHNKLIFNKRALISLRYLQKQYLDNNILVAKTSRLLNYNLVQEYLDYNTYIKNNITYINILSVNDPLMGRFVPDINDLRGITFYVGNPQKAEILLKGRPVGLNYITYNKADYTGQKSVGIKWFNKDTKDYTRY